MSENLRILKIRFDKVDLETATEKALTFAKSNRQHYICTPNPEFLLTAKNNPKFRDILNKSSLNIADGIGILWAATYLNSVTQNHSKLIKLFKWKMSLLAILFAPKRIRRILPERVTGADLLEEICREAASKPLRIFLLGGGEDVAKQTAEILADKYPGLKISGTYSGTPHAKDENKIIKEVNRCDPDILFVAYGAPSQEMWIARNIKKMKEVHLAIGVGGTFDFISGRKKRAPKFLRTIGLEWLWRLIYEPSRLKRIFNATIKFPIQIFISSL